MSNSRLQVILPDATLEKFDKEAKKQGRSKSNLAKKYITEGLIKDEANEKGRK